MSNESDLERFAYLWDLANGSSLSAQYNDLSRVRVFFDEKPTLEELKSARSLLPLSPAPTLQEFFHRYSAVAEIDVGVLPTRQATCVADECKKAGLKVALEDESFVSYLPIHPTTSRALLIEDDELSQRVCRRMLENGVPITQHIEA